MTMLILKKAEYSEKVKYPQIISITFIYDLKIVIYNFKIM